VSESAADRILEGIAEVLQGAVPRFDLEYREAGETGVRWFMLIATRLTGEQRGALIIRSDITQQKAREAGLLDRANNDALTGLANRSYFLLEATHMVALARRLVWHPALVYLDLDNFKDINDRHGHAVGDVVLGRVGARLRRLTRESDLLARLGGDEFVILLNDVTVADSARIVQVYRRSLARPPIIDGMPIIIQGSFGVAHYPVDGVTIEAMLAVADRAMYAAKSSWARRARRRGSGTMHARTENRASL
jgi:diguanylate cyclase (GGDEF)-like protein